MEQIIRILRESDTGGTVADVCRTHNISPQSFHRWKQKYGGMGLSEAQRLRDLEKENTELKKLLPNQFLKAKALEIALEKKPKPGSYDHICPLHPLGVSDTRSMHILLPKKGTTNTVYDIK